MLHAADSFIAVGSAGALALLIASRAWLRRCLGLCGHSHVEPSSPWPREVVPAQPLLAARIQEPPTTEQVETQMKFSAAISRCLDQGMSPDEVKEYVAACSDDINAGIEFPWRKKIAENAYEGSCGCVFNGDGERTHWCGDHY